jgi:hypothetical protein
MLHTHTYYTRRAYTTVPLLTEPHAQRRHWQRTCAISGTWGRSVCVCVFTHVEAQ